MGSYVSKLLHVSNSAVNSVYRRGRKRKCIEEDDRESDLWFIEKTMQTPKRRKLLTTAQYIYKTLFQEEKGSDITVLMLGKAWKLHKVYIGQSPYFASMFSGSWREANEKIINVEITDPNITHESLYTVFGTFYQDEISLEPKDVISMLATATLFQLQGLIDQCIEIMGETTNKQTVVPYYNAAVAYGVPKVKNTCKKWLEVNLMAHGWLHHNFLKEITPELMAELVASPNLIAMQTEFCVYMMLRVWLYVHLLGDETVEIDEFFRNHSWSEPFLDTKEGKEFIPPFKALRKKYLLLNEQDVNILQNDNIIPEDWLYEAYKQQWLHILKIDANKDTGPKSITEEVFDRECCRCARNIERAGEHVWRWTAFYFGLDIVVSLDLDTLRFRRYDKQDSGHIKANHNKHQIALKVSLISLNEQRQIKHIQNSGLINLSLHKNEDKQVMVLDKELTYPLYVSVNMQVVTPNVSSKEDKNANTILSNT